VTLERKIDATLAALGGRPKCLRSECDQPAEEGLDRWSLHYGLCVQHGKEHMERERKAKLDEEARKHERKMKAREAEEADRYAMHRYIGKCKACGANTSTLAQLTSWKDTAGHATWGYLDEHGKQLAESKVTQGITIPCRNCGKMIHPKKVHGVYKADEECGAKCQNAKGPNCECRCKGLSHGKAWGG